MVDIINEDTDPNIQIETPMWTCPTCGEKFDAEEKFAEHIKVHFTINEQTNQVLYKIATTPPKEVVEAVLIDTLSEIYRSYQVVYEETTTKLTQEESFLASIAITCEHLRLLNECFEPINEKTLNPKHRAFKSVAPAWYSVFSLEFAKLKEDPTSPSFNVAAKNAVQLMKDYHLMLHEDTSMKDRKQIVQDWVDVAAELVS